MSRFRSFNNIRKSFKGKLPESELLQLTDEICLNEDTWEGWDIGDVHLMLSTDCQDLPSHHLFLKCESDELICEGLSNDKIL